MVEECFHLVCEDEDFCSCSGSHEECGCIPQTNTELQTRCIACHAVMHATDLETGHPIAEMQ